MLKNLFDQYEQISILHSQKDANGKNILIQEAVCNRYERIFNGKFVELTIGGGLFSPSTVIIENNPHCVHKTEINDHEENIVLFYDDAEVKMIGHKQRRV